MAAPRMREERSLLDRLDRLVAALERLAPPPPAAADFAAAEAFVWQASPEAFVPVAHAARGSSRGIDGSRPVKPSG